MNAAVSHFDGIELLYLALYDLQVDEQIDAKHAEKQRERYKAQKEKPNTKRCARWRDTHPEEYKAYQREYRKTHKERLNAQKREYMRQRRLLAKEGKE